MVGLCQGSFERVDSLRIPFVHRFQDPVDVHGVGRTAICTEQLPTGTAEDGL
jgi:hypothetical protein